MPLYVMLMLRVWRTLQRCYSR